MSENNKTEVKAKISPRRASQKRKTVGLTLLTGALFIAAVTAPVVVMNQGKAEISTVKSTLIKEVRTTEAWDSFCGETAQTNVELQAKIDAETPENWKKWVVAVDANGKVKEDAIEAINSVSIHEIEGELTQWKVEFGVEWKADYEVEVDKIEKISINVKNHNVLVEWNNEEQVVNEFKSIFENEAIDGNVPSWFEELNKQENKDKIIAMTNHKDILGDVNSTVRYDATGKYWEVVSSFSLKTEEETKYKIVNTVTTLINDFSVAREVSNVNGAIESFINSKNLFAIQSSLGFLEKALYELNKVSKTDILKKITNGEFIDPNSVVLSNISGTRGAVNVRVEFKARPGFTLNTYAFDLTNLIIKQEMKWTMAGKDALTKFMNDFVPIQITNNPPVKVNDRFPPSDTDPSNLEVKEYFDTQMQDPEKLKAFLEINTYENPDGTDWREEIDSIQYKVTYSETSVTLTRFVQILSVQSSSYKVTISSDNERAYFDVQQYEEIPYQTWAAEEAYRPFRVKVLEQFNYSVGTFATYAEAEEYYNSRQSTYIHIFNSWLLANNFVEYNEFGGPYRQVAERYEISISDPHSWQSYVPVVDFTFYPARAHYQEGLTWNVTLGYQCWLQIEENPYYDPNQPEVDL